MPEGYKQGSFSRVLLPSAAGRAGDAGSSLYKTPSKAAVLSGGLLLCPFCFGCGCSCAVRPLLFSRWFSGLLARARTRPQPQNAAIYGVLLRLRFRAGLRTVHFGLLVPGPLARARARATPCEPSGLGPGPRKLASPASSGIGAGMRFSDNKHDMTWPNFKEAQPARGRRPKKTELSINAMQSKGHTTEGLCNMHCRHVFFSTSALTPINQEENVHRTLTQLAHN